MTSDLKIGDTVYLPFWIVLEFLDATPPDPFVQCRIISLGLKRANSPTGPVEYLACDLDLGKPHLTAYSIPAEYVIAPADLATWAERIAAWFRDYPKRISEAKPPVSHEPVTAGI